jgi:hypothetical protein
MRQAGKTCSACGVGLPPPHVVGERLCKKCGNDRPRGHRVYLRFERGQSWNCQFLEEDLKTALPRRLTLKDSQKLFQIAERGGATMSPSARFKIQQAINTGRGGMWLELTDEQYEKLKRR